ncbi:MAG: hypothetical protein WAM97_20795, partial [Acidimicrobiales bacterium]
TWPDWVEVSFAHQAFPLGTTHAVLCARSAVGDGPFGVVNGDDIYGRDALQLLSERLIGGQNLLVAFRLGQTVLTADPVTRGVTITDASGRLTGLAERRKVARNPDGTFTSGDGLEPASLNPDALVSMNLWGFQPDIWDFFQEAVVQDHPEIGPDGALIDPSRPPANENETLLPEVVGNALSAGRINLELAAASGSCVGVTHADDLPVAQGVLAKMISSGDRSEWLWERPH